MNIVRKKRSGGAQVEVYFSPEAGVAQYVLQDNNCYILHHVDDPALAPTRCRGV